VDPGPPCMGSSRSGSCSGLSKAADRSWPRVSKPGSVLFFFSKHWSVVTDLWYQELGAFLLMRTPCYLITCAFRAPQHEECNENLSPLRARQFSNWDKKRVVLGQSQAEEISGQGISFSPLKSLQNPIGKAELHH